MSEPQTAVDIEDSFRLPSPTPSEPGPGQQVATREANGGGLLTLDFAALARDPAVDVSKLDALLQMAERIEKRNAEREFIAAFARLSADLPRVKKNGTIELGKDKDGKARGSIPFARWEDMDKIIRPLMVREGFTLSFDSAPRQGEGGGLIVTGTLMHRDGHTRTASIPLPLDGGPGRNNLQAMGSSLSYGKRYTAEMLLNIVREGEDDDGKAGGARYITADQAEELRKYLKATGTEEEPFLRNYFEVSKVENLEVAAGVAARNMLLQKLDKQSKAKRGDG